MASITEAEIIKVMQQFNFRAAKLMIEGTPFIVISNKEPYYLQVYGMIRMHEMEKGTWTDRDEEIYLAARETYYETNMKGKA